MLTTKALVSLFDQLDFDKQSEFLNTIDFSSTNFLKSMKPKQLETLSNKAKSMLELKAENALNKYRNRVEELVNHCPQCSTWGISIPKKGEDLVVKWLQPCEMQHLGKTYPCWVKMVFNDKNIRIAKSVGCVCLSPRFCHGCQHLDLNCDLCTASIDEQNIISYNINTTDPLFRQWSLDVWAPRVLQVFLPVFKEFNKLVSDFEEETAGLEEYIPYHYVYHTDEVYDVD